MTAQLNALPGKWIETLTQLADILGDGRTTTDSGLPVTVLELIDVQQAAASEIRALLAQPKGSEPVAWLVEKSAKDVFFGEEAAKRYAAAIGAEAVPLYAAAPPSAHGIHRGAIHPDIERERWSEPHACTGCCDEPTAPALQASAQGVDEESEKHIETLKRLLKPIKVPSHALGDHMVINELHFVRGETRAAVEWAIRRLAASGPAINSSEIYNKPIGGPRPGGDYVLVPREPTQEMVQLGHEALMTNNVRDSSEQGRVRRIYRAMLAATQAPAGGEAGISEHQKAWIDAATHGVGFVVNGKRVPPESVQITTAPDVERKP